MLAVIGFHLLGKFASDQMFTRSKTLGDQANQRWINIAIARCCMLGRHSQSQFVAAANQFRRSRDCIGDVVGGKRDIDAVVFDFDVGSVIYEQHLLFVARKTLNAFGYFGSLIEVLLPLDFATSLILAVQLQIH